MTTLTIHRSLELIKKHTKKVKDSKQSELVATVKGKEQAPQSKEFKSKSELQTYLQGNFDSFFGSLELIAQLKEKISQSNLETKVNYLGKEVSITKLLAIKETLDIRKERLASLRYRLKDISNTIQTNNERYQLELNKIENAEIVKSRTKDFFEYEELSIITGKDSVSPTQLVEALILEVETLEYEVNSLLSESNIKTTIVIDE